MYLACRKKEHFQGGGGGFAVKPANSDFSRIALHWPDADFSFSVGPSFKTYNGGYPTGYVFQLRQRKCLTSKIFFLDPCLICMAF